MLIREIFERLRGDKSRISLESLFKELRCLDYPFLSILVQYRDLATKGVVQLGEFLELHNQLPSCTRCAKEFVHKDGNWDIITDFCSISCRKKKDTLERSALGFTFDTLPTKQFLTAMIELYETIKRHRGTPFVHLINCAKKKQIFFEGSSEEAFIGYFSYLNTSVFILLCKELLLRNEYIRCLNCERPYKVRQNEDANALVLEGYCCKSCRYSSETTRSKIRATCLERFGAASNLTSHSIARGIRRKREHFSLIRDSFAKKNIEVISLEEEYVGTTKGGVSVKCASCSSVWKQSWIQSSSYFLCRTCEPSNRSQQESAMLNYIKGLLPEGELILSNDRKVLKPKELDIYVPSRNLAVEVNGVFWHSTNLLEEVAAYRRRHLDKTEACLVDGVQLIHVTDIEVMTKPELIKSVLASRLGVVGFKVAGRKCVVKSVNVGDVKAFLLENHLQGFVRSTINLGLYFEGELVQLMTFGKARFKAKANYELLRLCTKRNYSILGGSEKLFKHFVANYLLSGETVLSYCDRRFFEGVVYTRLGFSFVRITSPNYVYLDKRCNYAGSRHDFQKHKLAKILLNFDASKSEIANMFAHGYRIMFDCGNSVWEYRKA